MSSPMVHENMLHFHSSGKLPLLLRNVKLSKARTLAAAIVARSFTQQRGDIEALEVRSESYSIIFSSRTEQGVYVPRECQQWPTTLQVKSVNQKKAPARTMPLLTKRNQMIEATI
jgi:hypothetical protein